MNEATDFNFFFTFLVGDLALAKLKSSTNKDGSEKFWSFIEPQKCAPPEVISSDWVKGDIDRFILFEIEKMVSSLSKKQLQKF